MHSGFRERGRGSLDGQSETTFTTMADSEAEVENQGTVKNSQDAARRKPQSTACVPLGGGEEATTSSFSAHLAGKHVCTFCCMCSRPALYSVAAIKV